MVALELPLDFRAGGGSGGAQPKDNPNESAHAPQLIRHSVFRIARFLLSPSNRFIRRESYHNERRRTDASVGEPAITAIS